VIIPTFDAKIDWIDDKNEDELSTLLLAVPPDENLHQALVDSRIEGISLEESETETFLKRGKALFTDDSPSNVLLAAYLTMRGVSVVAYDAPLLRAVLGPGGYIAVPHDEEGARWTWTKILDDAMSEAGRSASASARRFLKKNYAASDAVESLEKLYQSVTRTVLKEKS
jgi:glycosyltransferase involved in cell wall biosynthesis